MGKLFLKYRREKKLLRGHLWIYSGEVERTEDCVAGEPADVYTAKKNFIGRGFYNDSSKIVCRLLTTEEVPLDRKFFASRIMEALSYRQRLYPRSDTYRLVNSEGDFLPGLIIDKYSDVLVIQTLTLGMENHKEEIADILHEILNPTAIVERNDVNVRHHENLEPMKSVLRGILPGDKIEIELKGIKYYIDVMNGQKTGFFLDQVENALKIRKYVKDLNVLDCFCHTGQFAFNSLKGGARSVMAIDMSNSAVELAEENAELNGCKDQIEWGVANVFDTLRSFEKHGVKFDFIILDPPSFSKSRAAVENAKKGYNEINLRAMKIIKPGGFLVTSTCSYHVTEELFKNILDGASRDARKRLRLIEMLSQSRDHPILLGVPETHYLNCIIMQVFDH